MSLVAQVSFKLPNNPVPITGQTFGVLLSAAAVGPLRGLAGQLLYIAIGWAGLPVLASALIYVPGVWWLAHVEHWSYTKAITTGVSPFVLGDLLKALAAGALLPAAWKLVVDRTRR